MEVTQEERIGYICHYMSPPPKIEKTHTSHSVALKYRTHPIKVASKLDYAPGRECELPWATCEVDLEALLNFERRISRPKVRVTLIVNVSKSRIAIARCRIKETYSRAD